MNITAALLLILLAGIVNGSFALPTKHIKHWSFENIWLNYSYWSFLILPWLAIALLAPQVFSVYQSAPASILWVMIIAGLGFGIGQICFALALKMIGFGLGFVINLGIAIGLGFSLPLIFQHSDDIFTLFGLMTLIGSILAILGLIFSTYAGHLHDRRSEKPSANEKHYFGGVLLAIIAGLFSAGQNFAFSYTVDMQHMALTMHASTLGASIIMWPGFLFFTFIPYFIYMLYLHKKNNSWYQLRGRDKTKYYLFAIIMGLFWFGSLIFYSKAAQLIGDLGPVVGWPLFMVLIILTSNFWGWRYKEWEGSSAKVRNTLFLGIAFLILAILVLAYSSHLHS
ncbi:MAG: hypothetical protein A3F10_03890 [Coxiella sp. RIFCSPHIGHO2_12_FULL_42_15]|nr:MAG: hypothetical protein A3F10_03890 [Coxiella sp. RIFCSPHIGHO2_12_FULL_42_15]